MQGFMRFMKAKMPKFEFVNLYDEDARTSSPAVHKVVKPAAFFFVSKALDKCKYELMTQGCWRYITAGSRRVVTLDGAQVQAYLRKHLKNRDAAFFEPSTTMASRAFHFDNKCRCLGENVPRNWCHCSLCDHSGER